MLSAVSVVLLHVFFFGSLQCFGFFVVDEAEGPASCARVDRMRLCQMGAVLATKLSSRLSLSSIQLPRRRVGRRSHWDLVMSMYSL